MKTHSEVLSGVLLIYLAIETIAGFIIGDWGLITLAATFIIIYMIFVEKFGVQENEKKM